MGAESKSDAIGLTLLTNNLFKFTRKLSVFVRQNIAFCTSSSKNVRAWETVGTTNLARNVLSDFPYALQHLTK